MSMDLKKIYNGSFSSRQRFDDGGSAYSAYAALDPSQNYNYSNTNTQQGSGAPSAGDISGLTSGATSGANSIGAEVGSNPAAGFSTSGDPGQGSSGLSGALGALSGAKGSAVLTALTAILGAAGHMQTSKANATLPTMPGMGALPSLPGGSSTGGYGPSGGYNYSNYKGLTAGSPGTGYAPRTQAPAAPLSSYYTYGQGPEQQFFQQVNPQGGQIAPVTHKRGGRVKKYAMGGMVPQGPMAHPGAMPRPVMPAGPGARPMAPRPAMGAAPMMAPKMNAMMPGSRPGMRPFAAGGQSQGALSAPEQGSRYVQGPGDGTSDDIPARLANGEYVLSADVVSGLGNGDNSSGAKVLDGFVHSLRTHKAENSAKGKLPADAKPIHHYMKGGK